MPGDVELTVPGSKLHRSGLEAGAGALHDRAHDWRDFRLSADPGGLRVDSELLS